MYKKRSHFSLQHYEGTLSGPVSFLNPTTRRSPVQSKPQITTSPASSHGREQDGEIEDSTSATRKLPSPGDEIQASAVEQKWRSRDNRKGTGIYHIPLELLMLILHVQVDTPLL